MIRLGLINLDELGLHIKNVDGLFDFPQLKDDGNKWSDRNFVEAKNRLQDYQYKEKKIKLNCYVVADTGAELLSRLANIKAAISGDGLRMLVVSDYSNMAYMVRLAKTTILKPHRYFESGRNVATFSLDFIEPAAFAIKFYWDFSAVPAETQVDLNFVLSKASKTQSTDSTKQSFVDIYFNDFAYSTNLEQADYTINAYNLPHRLLPIIISGQIDSIENINITSSYPPQGISEADYFLRNGQIIAL